MAAAANPVVAVDAVVAQYVEKARATKAPESADTGLEPEETGKEPAQAKRTSFGFFGSGGKTKKTLKSETVSPTLQESEQTSATSEASDSAAKPAKTFSLFRRASSPQSPTEALQPEMAPPPPPKPPSKRRPRLSATSGFLSFVMIVSLVIMVLIASSQRYIHLPGPLNQDKVVQIVPGADVPEIIAQLAREDVIDNTVLMNIWIIIQGVRTSIKAGEYLFHKNVSMQEVIDILVSGRAVLHSITLPEGLTSEQIVQRLNDNDVLVGEIREVPKEGSLLPETYKFSRGMTRDAVIQQMMQAQARVLREVWSRRSPDIPMRSPFELVILASIVEKETGKADERPRVAGVFMNRLLKKMRLQSDPTIVYGLVGGRGTLGRSILRSEVEQKTPYNTYVIDGLPPGPIANPGRAALEAAANPSRTRDLFFVADGTGGHVFAETLDQHTRNVARWRQIEKDVQDRLNPDSDKPSVPTVSPPAGAVPGKPEKRGELDANPSIYGGLVPGMKSARERSVTLHWKVDERPRILMAESDPTPAPAKKPATLAAASSDRMAFTGLGAALVGKNSHPVLNDEEVMPGLSKQDITRLQSKKSSVTEPGPTSVVAVTSAPDSNIDDVNPALIPMSDKRLSEQKSRLAKLGLPQSAETLVDLSPDRPLSSAASIAALVGDTSATASVRSGGIPVTARAFDASEGTSLDPLKDTTFDLNFPKTVPSFR